MSRLRELREARAWSQDELALRVKVTQGGIARVESGDRLLGLGSLVKLAVALDVPVCELISDEDELADMLRRATGCGQ